MMFSIIALVKPSQIYTLPKINRLATKVILIALISVILFGCTPKYEANMLKSEHLFSCNDCIGQIEDINMDMCSERCIFTDYVPGEKIISASEKNKTSVAGFQLVCPDSDYTSEIISSGFEVYSRL